MSSVINDYNNTGEFNEKLKSLKDKSMEELSTKIDMLAAAYLRETNIPASECELIQEQSQYNFGYTYYFRRRITNNYICINCNLAGKGCKNYNNLRTECNNFIQNLVNEL